MSFTPDPRDKTAVFSISIIRYSRASRRITEEVYTQLMKYSVQLTTLHRASANCNLQGPTQIQRTLQQEVSKRSDLVGSKVLSVADFLSRDQLWTPLRSAAYSWHFLKSRGAACGHVMTRLYDLAAARCSGIGAGRNNIQTHRFLNMV